MAGVEPANTQYERQLASQARRLKFKAQEASSLIQRRRLLRQAAELRRKAALSKAERYRAAKGR